MCLHSSCEVSISEHIVDEGVKARGDGGGSKYIRQFRLSSAQCENGNLLHFVVQVELLLFREYEQFGHFRGHVLLELTCVFWMFLFSVVGLPLQSSRSEVLAVSRSSPGCILRI